MTPEQYLNTLVNKFVDGGQCVGLASTYSRLYLKTPDFFNHNAKDVYQYAPDSLFIKILNNPQDYNQHPEEGDIIIWNAWTGNPYGHIAVCSWTSNGNNFISYDQNWPAGSSVHRQYHDYGNVKGWLRPRNRFWKVDPQIAIDAANAAKLKAEADRIAAEKAVADAKALADKLEAERIAKELAAQKEIADAQARLEAERLAEEEKKALEEASTQETIKEGEDMERFKSPVLLTAILAQILLVVGFFVPQLSEPVKIVGGAIIQILILFGIVNNPTDPNHI